MILAFSGPVDPPSFRDMRDFYWECLAQFDEPIAIMSGCAFGIDTDVTHVAIDMWPRVPVILVIPAAPHNFEFAMEMSKRPSTRIIRMTAYEGMPKSARYMERNDKMAEIADALVAFPFTRTEEIRSGTWATVRRFRKRGKPTDIYPIHPER